MKNNYHDEILDMPLTTLNPWGLSLRDLPMI